VARYVNPVQIVAVGMQESTFRVKLESSKEEDDDEDDEEENPLHADSSPPPPLALDEIIVSPAASPAASPTSGGGRTKGSYGSPKEIAAAYAHETDGSSYLKVR
jgi:hypothetical protein